MAPRRETSLLPGRFARDPLALMRSVTAELDRWFDEFMAPSFRLPLFRRGQPGEEWYPEIDVFERDNRLITRVDLPGMKKEDVKVEVVDGQLTISGERKREAEEKGEHYYRSEREYGSFCRTVPLPEGAKFDDVKATFADGVLEVSVPLPPRPSTKVHKVEIEEPKAARSAA